MDFHLSIARAKIARAKIARAILRLVETGLLVAIWGPAKCHPRKLLFTQLHAGKSDKHDHEHLKREKCKMATLFSYFKKSPKTKATTGINEQKCSSDNVEYDTPRSKLHENSKLKPHVREVDDTTVSKSEDECNIISIGEIVWAKLEGYPWWPSMICNHPNSERFQMEDSDNDGEEKVHVQFFGEPPSRDWVLKRFVISSLPGRYTVLMIHRVVYYSKKCDNGFL